MDNFLEILQEFKENSFQYKKQLQIVLVVCGGWGGDFFFLLIIIEFQLLKNSYKGKVSVARQIRVK